MIPTKHPLTRQGGRFLPVLILIASIGFGGVFIGCRKEKDSSLASVEVVDDEAADEAREARPPEPREAFGLPFPPEIREVTREPTLVRVTTPMSLDALQEFFSLRAPEYEYVRLNRTVRALQLYSYLPELRIYSRGGRRGYRVVEYRVPRSWYSGEVEELEGVPEKFAAAARDIIPQTVRSPEPEASRQKGDPVTLRTAEGELLAPGARWGEPYVPPVGSPLHTERNRSNFGRPFGEWHVP